MLVNLKVQKLLAVILSFFIYFFNYRRYGMGYGFLFPTFFILPGLFCIWFGGELSLFKGKLGFFTTKPSSEKIIRMAGWAQLGLALGVVFLQRQFLPP